MKKRFNWIWSKFNQKLKVKQNNFQYLTGYYQILTRYIKIFQMLSRFNRIKSIFNQIY